MKILVFGAGVIGVTSAWYLAKAGHKVTVVDRQPAAGMETSFANGGQISVSHAEPWANPGAPAKILKWLWREDAPLLFRMRVDVWQWLWSAKFLRECLPQRTAHNIRQIVSLGMYSRESLASVAPCDRHFLPASGKRHLAFLYRRTRIRRCGWTDTLDATLD